MQKKQQTNKQKGTIGDFQTTAVVSKTVALSPAGWMDALRLPAGTFKNASAWTQHRASDPSSTRVSCRFFLLLYKRKHYFFYIKTTWRSLVASVSWTIGETRDPNFPAVFGKKKDGDHRDHCLEEAETTDRPKLSASLRVSARLCRAHSPTWTATFNVIF